MGRFQFPIVYRFGVGGAFIDPTVRVTLSFVMSVASGELQNSRELSLVDLARVIDRERGGVVDLDDGLEAGEPYTLAALDLCKGCTHCPALG